jgi:hypothetical protein
MYAIIFKNYLLRLFVHCLTEPVEMVLNTSDESAEIFELPPTLQYQHPSSIKYFIKNTTSVAKPTSEFTLTDTFLNKTY